MRHAARYRGRHPDGHRRAFAGTRAAGHVDLSGAAQAAAATAARAGSDARARRGDQLRLHQRARPGRRQRPDLLRRLDARGQQGDLRPEDQAAACGGECSADPSRRHREPRRDHGSERRLPRRLRGFAARRCARADPLRRHARRAIGRQFHRIPQRRLHRLRAMQGGSQEAAEMAGQSGAHDPRPGREDDLFRGRPAGVSRRAVRLHPVFLGARPHRQAQVGLSGAELRQQQRLRPQHLRALFLGARPQLRFDPHADDHDEAGSPVAGRMAPPAGQRRLHHPRLGPLPGRQGRIPAERHSGRPGTAIGAAAWKRRANSTCRKNGYGVGTERC